MSYFEAALQIHKERFPPHKALLVLDDKTLRRYVMCWGPQLVKLLDDYPLDNDLPTLWKCVQVDYAALADLSGDSLPNVMANFRQAQGLELIYPDGSVAREVIEVLDKRLKSIKSFS